MKKIIILVLISLMVIVFATSVFVMAKEKEGKGAVRVDLNKRLGSEVATAQGGGDAAGWAIINTTASDKVQVQIHMYDADEGTYGVYVGEQGNWDIVTKMTVKKNGNGNIHVEFDIPADADSLVIQVVVYPEGGVGMVGYTNGLTEVPLKK